MNPIENPMMQMMQAFGATSAQSAAAMFGIQGAAGDIQENYAALFSGYIDSAEGTSGAQSVQSFLQAYQDRAQAIHAAPADTAFAIDPTAASSTADLFVQANEAGGDALANLLAGLSGDKSLVSPEMLEAFSLSLDYQAVTPLELSPANLNALQAAISGDMSAVNAQMSKEGFVLQTAVVDATGSLANNQSSHMLPASELKYILGETTALPESLMGAAPGVVLGDVPHAQQPVQAVQPVTGAEQVQQVVVAGSAEAAGVSNASNQASGGSAPDLATDITRVPTAEKTAAPATLTQTGNQAETLDADGQVLAVNQQNQQRKTPQAAAAQAGSPAKATELAQTLAASAGNSATPSASAGGEKRAEPAAKTPEVTADASRAATTPPASAQPAPAPTRPIDWTSPWTTPERAAGWPDGSAPGLISTGLGGLMGQGNAISSMGLMGGQPNPALGGQVAKQLNVNITRAVKAGENQFSMRMDPPDLGRVTVKLTFGQDGLVKSQVIAERPETLELLQRETRGLERAVESGGHKSAPDGISFSLDSGGQESAGKAFAEAMQEDRLKETIENGNADVTDSFNTDGEIIEQADLDEILAHVTPETGLDVRV